MIETVEVVAEPISPEMRAAIQALIAQAFVPDKDVFTFVGLAALPTTPLKNVARLLDISIKPYDRGYVIEQIWWRMQNGVTKVPPLDWVPIHKVIWRRRMKTVVKVKEMGRCMACLATDFKNPNNKFRPKWRTYKAIKRIFLWYGRMYLYDHEATMLWFEFNRYYAPLYGIEIPKRKHRRGRKQTTRVFRRKPRVRM